MVEVQQLSNKFMLYLPLWKPQFAIVAIVSLKAGEIVDEATEGDKALSAKDGYDHLQRIYLSVKYHVANTVERNQLSQYSQSSAILVPAVRRTARIALTIYNGTVSHLEKPHMTAWPRTSYFTADRDLRDFRLEYA